jgi:hypothetical protein
VKIVWKITQVVGVISVCEYIGARYILVVAHVVCETSSLPLLPLPNQVNAVSMLVS